MEFLVYQAKAAVLLALFYMFYRLLLSKETLHRFNRIVLLATAALSFVLPFCVITIRKVVMLPAQTGDAGITSEAVAELAETASPWWQTVLFVIFIAGALISLGFTLMSILRVRQIVRRGEKIAYSGKGQIVVTEEKTAPFSWMKYIVLSREDYESDHEHILTHERAHIALGHSFDLIFVDLVTAMQWFNPAIWMLKSDLRALHEYEADDAVLRSGANIKEYQYLLIKKAVGKSGYSVANSFNHSTLKNRITMMSNKKSSRLSAWKALYVFPLVGISLAASAETKFDYRYEEQSAAQWDSVKVVSSFNVKGSINLEDLPKIVVEVSDLEENKPLYIVDGKVAAADFNLKSIDPETIESIDILKDKTTVEKYGEAAKNGVIIIKFKDEAIPFQLANAKPGFNGGDVNEFSKWVAQNMQYPEEAFKKNVTGRVTVSFTVGSDGVVKDVKVLRGVDPLLDAEAVRVVSSSPKWTPAIQDGKPVAITFTFPVIFAKR